MESSCCGGVGLLFMFGQTGSGKTHTMRLGEREGMLFLGAPTFCWLPEKCVAVSKPRCAIEEMASRDVFASLGDDAEPEVSIQFLELRGDKCFDLLASATGRQP